MIDRANQFDLNNNDQSQSSNIHIKIEPQSEVISSYRIVRGQSPPYESAVGYILNIRTYLYGFSNRTSQGIFSKA
jgi:hypothetical protein